MKGLLFTLGLSYGGAVVSLFSPFIGLLIYVAFAILRPESLWFWSVPQGNYSRVVAIGLLVGWMIHGLGNWQFGKAALIVWSLLCLLAWATFSALFIAPNEELAWRFVEILAKIVLPFLVGITLIDSIAKLKQLAWVILLSEGYLALEFNLWYLSGYNLLWLEGFGSMDNNCNAIALVTCFGLAIFLGMGSPKWWQQAIAFGAAALMAHAIMFSFSRGGMLSLLVTSGVAFWLIPKRPIHLLGLVIGALILWRMAGPEVIDRFVLTFTSAEQRDASAQSRLVLWWACVDAMAQQPFGIGTANWGEIVERYGFERGKLAHSLWLQLGAELGIPGLIFLLLFYGGCVLKLLPLAKERSIVPHEDYRNLSRMVIASLIGFGVSAQFVSLDLLEHPYYITLIGAGLLKLLSTPSAWTANSALLPPTPAAHLVKP